MKKLTLTLCAVTALVSAAYAGPERYSGKEMKQAVEQTAPCPQWYADQEWNVGIWGTYAATTNNYREDRYLGVDHAFGGGLDAKYFFRRYFGLGVEGFALSLNRQNSNFNNNGGRDIAGAALGTFTFRYPIPCSRFAPYAWAGVGGIFGGGNSGGVLNTENTNNVFTNGNNSDDGRLMGQYGAGFEVRFTPHIGLLNDISFNQVEGGHNDFIMARTGVNFAF
ncbi:MAG: outer membrane beta-barrel protein [Chthoniobacterales bacterium]